MDYLFGISLWSDFSRHSPVWGDFKPIFALMVFFYGFEYVCNYLFEKLGRFLVRRSKGEKYLEENPERIENFKKRGYILITHIMLTAIAWYLFQNEDWWYLRGFRLGMQSGRKKFGWSMRFYMNVNAADYVYKTIVLVIRSKLYGKPKDYGEMMFHHILSFVMIFYSFITTYCEFAVMFLYISNQTDCFTYSARMSNDIKLKYPSYILLPLMMIVWIFNRLFYNPFVLIPAGYSMIKYYYIDNASYATIHGPILINLTVGLYILHVHWIYGLLRITFKTITQGVASENIDHMAYDQKKQEIQDLSVSKDKEVKEGTLIDLKTEV